MTSFETVPAAEWQEWVAGNQATILDVREPDEWELGTLPGSTRMSIGEIVDRSGELEPETAVLCVCRSGARSQQVAMYLSTIGFDKVANMGGGLKALGMQD